MITHCRRGKLPCACRSVSIAGRFRLPALCAHLLFPHVSSLHLVFQRRYLRVRKNLGADNHTTYSKYIHSWASPDLYLCMYVCMHALLPRNMYVPTRAITSPCGSPSTSLQPAPHLCPSVKTKRSRSSFSRAKIPRFDSRRRFDAHGPPSMYQMRERLSQRGGSFTFIASLSRMPWVLGWAILVYNLHPPNSQIQKN